MRALLVAFVLVWWSAVAFAGCQPNRVELRGDWGQAQFTVELAQTPEQHARGLMYRESMPSSAGMLFLYERPQRLSFWMRNTLIELDMIFVDPKGVVKHVHSRAQPLDETPIHGGRGLVAVLEINGGLAERLGIAPGSEMRHAFFGPDAAWPC